MSATPAPKPRISAIPTPGRSSIPTPGRLRASSSASTAHPPPLPTDNATLEHAFASAIKNNNPARYTAATPNLSPSSSSSFRPPSVASNARPKTPSASLNKSTYRRPESRQSDVFNRGPKTFEIGDEVRIESQGFEGTLRYLGEIQGKQGLFAGVELSAGFAGRGKNDGSVDGVRYFQCPEKCGVFVASTKLSAPAVRPSHRPPSVASSRASISGRITPSVSGRITPSFSNGRLTPSVSNGRVTPVTAGPATPSTYGFSTPAAKARSSLARSVAVPAAITPSASAMSKITAGSRASKYIGVTAKQLASRDSQLLAPASPNRYGSIPSPTRSTAESPVGQTPKPLPRVSGIGTPKSFGTGRPSLATPRARIPSAVAMPPPPSPSIGKGSSRSVSVNEKLSPASLSTARSDSSLDDRADDLSSIRQNGKALQEKIQLIMSGKGTPSLDNQAEIILSLGNDHISEATQNAETELLRMQIAKLHDENIALKMQSDSNSKADEASAALESIRLERDNALAKLADVESQAKANERAVKERNMKIESLERTALTNTETLDRLKAESEGREQHHQEQLADSEKLIASLKEALEVQANAAGQNEGVIQAKNAEIALLENRIQKVAADLEKTKVELGGEVEMLREAGQETIALYEERINAAEATRYDLEDTIEVLQERLTKLDRPQSPNSIMKNASEAAQIENETLREQTAHLQKKVVTLEELLEDARLAAERDEVAIRARITKYKENEAGLKREIGEGKKEIERITREEESARRRIAELEEALQENTIALENARAEVETLRFEVSNAETELNASGAANAGHSDSQHTLLVAEVARLKVQLEEAKAAKKKLADQLDASQQDMADTTNSLINLRQTVETLDSEKADLEHAHHEQGEMLMREQTVVTELRRALEEKASELELTRKNFNRDRPLSTLSIESAGSSTPSKAEREEIKGLKHIVQEMQKENAALSHQCKLLESENKVLLSETDQLRDELKLLEESVEASLLQQERAMDIQEGLLPQDDDQGVQGALKDMKTKHDADMEQLRKRFAEAEMKYNRTIHDLNKEIGELESLVESKIYREDELERELERLRDKVSRTKKSSKSSMEIVTASSDGQSSSTARGSIGSISASSNAETSSGEPCEICDKLGHDIFSCPVLKDGAMPGISPSAGTASQKPGSSDLWCEDCESHGHVAADCPHALEVF